MAKYYHVYSMLYIALSLYGWLNCLATFMMVVVVYYSKCDYSINNILYK